MQENTHSRAPLPSWELLCHRGLPSPHNHGDPAYSKPNQKVTQNLCMTYFFASSPLQSFFEWFSNNLVKFCASLMAQLVKNPPAMQETWVDPWVGKILWRREWLPTPVFWPGEFHRLYSPWGRKEPDLTDQLSLSLIISPQDNVVHSSFSWYSQSYSVSILKKVNGPLKLILNKKAPSSLIIWGITLKRLLWLGHCTCDSAQETSFQPHLYLGCTHLLS